MVDSPATSRLPDFVIVGAQKAATSRLAAWLRAHPGVAMPAGETLFFRDLEYAAHDLSELAAEFPPESVSQRRGIKCPEYLPEIECAPRIHADLDEPHIVVSLRDPIARCVSAYFWYMRWGYLPLAPVDVGLTALLDGTYDDNPVASRVLTFGRYADDLARYYGLWPATKIHVTTDLELAADAGAVYRSLCAFLDLDASGTPPETNDGANAGIYDLRRLRFLARRNHLLRGDVDGHARLALPASRAGVAYSAAISAVDRFGLAHVYRDARPTVGATVRQRLIDYYSDSITRTETLIGRDLSAWVTADVRQGSSTP
jgi:hypothetical protein